MRGQSRKTLARRHNAVLIAVMAVATPLIATFAGPWRAPAYGWGVASIVYLVLVWAHISRLDASGTAAYASSEEPSRLSRALLVNLAAFIALASLGMTYQISDTAITQPEMRRVALVHSIYAFVFGIAITATSINLVISLGS